MHLKRFHDLKKNYVLVFPCQFKYQSITCMRKMLLKVYTGHPSVWTFRYHYEFNSCFGITSSVYVPESVHGFVHVCMNLVVCMCVCVCMCMYMYIYVCMCIYLYIYVFVCVCVCMCLCICICLSVWLWKSSFVIGFLFCLFNIFSCQHIMTCIVKLYVRRSI